jgi:translocation and assembly module TamA
LLAIYQERDREDIAPARIRRLHGNAAEEIRTALRPFGHYRARVDGTLNQNGDNWIAHYEVDPGPPVRIASVDVDISGAGADDPAFRALRERFPLEAGNVLNHAAYEQAKQRFQAVAAERGYFDLRFARHEIRLDLEAYNAHINLDVDTGRRYRFGEITIEQDLLSQDLLDRYVRLQPGDPYSTAALLELQNALTASNYYANVQVDADPLEARDGRVPVRVQLSPREQNKYTFGIGYGTDTGPRGQIGWERFYLNEQGHHTRLELRGSDIEKSITAGYFIPIRNPRTDQLAITGGYNEGDTATATTQIRRLAVSRSTVRGHTIETLSVTHQRERFTIGAQTGDSTLLLPGVNWTYYLGDERIYTRQGGRAALDLRGAAEDIASDTSLLQARLQAKAILPILGFGRVIGRGEIGTTSIDDFSELPASLRFFAGGDVSVRGYDYNTLGPTDATGAVIGGRHLLVGSIEYEQQLTGNWAAAVFYDVGNAVNDFRDPLRKGAGIGARWRSPIGQIRIDAATALSEPGQPWRLHLYIGPDL